uniref:Uncharacterized protein n=1 Tax=Solanum tuberosum TaxID=4113 RepID=M1DQV7_SOLTU
MLFKIWPLEEHTLGGMRMWNGKLPKLLKNLLKFWESLVPVNPNVGTTETRVRDFSRMNHLESDGYKNEELPQESIDDVFKLVGTADALGDPPFDLLHRFSAFAFSIFAFWNIGRYSTASQNYSATRRLLFFIADLIFSFRVQHTGTLGEVKAIQRLAECVRRSSGLIFFVFSAVLFLFAM